MNRRNLLICRHFGTSSDTSIKIPVDPDNLRFHTFHVGTAYISSRYLNNLEHLNLG